MEDDKQIIKKSEYLFKKNVPRGVDYPVIMNIKGRRIEVVRGTSGIHATILK